MPVFWNAPGESLYARPSARSDLRGARSPFQAAGAPGLAVVVHGASSLGSSDSVTSQGWFSDLVNCMYEGPICTIDLPRPPGGVEPPPIIDDPPAPAPGGGGIGAPGTIFGPDGGPPDIGGFFRRRPRSGYVEDLAQELGCVGCVGSTAIGGGGEACCNLHWSNCQRCEECVLLDPCPGGPGGPSPGGPIIIEEPSAPPEEPGPDDTGGGDTGTSLL
jgi:hypothetical protein